MNDLPGVRAGGPAATRAPDELDLACRDVVELLSDYLDGDLDPPLAAAVERHLALCPACIEYLRQLRQVEFGGMNDDRTFFDDVSCWRA